MASFYHRLALAAVKSPYKSVPKRKPCLPLRPCRLFHQGPVPYARGLEDREQRESSSSVPSDAEKQPFQFKLEDLSPEERKEFESLDPGDQAAVREEMKAEFEHMSSPEYETFVNAESSLAANNFYESLPRMAPRPKTRDSLSYLGFGDDDEIDGFGKEDDFDGDDITNMGHGQLEQHREIREYARVAVWEMPLLHKLAKPFEPPTTDTPLRFRMTTYLGESHPAAKKVTVEFRTRDLATAAGLTEAQRIKLIKLVGVRYNPDTDAVKMGSEVHETPMQNKRYLADLVQDLIKEAKDGKDTFEDIPLDFRHHRPKKMWYFPEDWKLGDSNKREQLLTQRAQSAQIEAEKIENDQLVDGRRILDEALLRMPRNPQRVLNEPRRVN